MSAPPSSSQGPSTTHIPDLELRVHASRESQTTATPTPTLDARTNSSHTLSPPPLHHSPRQLNDDALGAFFGGRAHRTRTQQRAPPPYSLDWDGEKLPGYATSPPDFESETVARHMFRYGFLFPLFWVVGVYFLFVPIRVNAEWQPDKTEEEKNKLLSELREVEVKWAKRCLWALLSFSICLVILIVAVVLSRH